jgi:hypothetical protein
MKKYNVYFSLFNLFNETQKEVVRLQTIFKGLMGTSMVVTWVESNSTYALWVGIAAGFIDMLLACFYFEEQK